MKSPFTGKEMTIVKEVRTMKFRKEEFQMLFHAYRCPDTGEQFEDDDFAKLNYNQVVNQYRSKYNIPFSEQIIDIRKTYKLSATKMSEILGFGVNSYRNYEAGEVPSQSNARLIHLASNPHEFKKLVQLCGTLDPKTIDKIVHRIDSLLEEKKKSKFDKQLESYYLGTSLPSSQTGFKTPDFEKFSQMVIFFTKKLEPWKTKMNKLLFYADFYTFKKTGFSISGVQYVAMPMGPVPNNFNSIFDYLARKDRLGINYTHFPNGGTGEQFKPNTNSVFNEGFFNDLELQILNSVAEQFKDLSTNDIIEYSHKEKAWIENHEETKVIDYKYGFELN